MLPRDAASRASRKEMARSALWAALERSTFMVDRNSTATRVYHTAQSGDKQGSDVRRDLTNPCITGLWRHTNEAHEDDASYAPRRLHDRFDRRHSRLRLSPPPVGDRRPAASRPHLLYA